MIKVHYAITHDECYPRYGRYVLQGVTRGSDEAGGDLCEFGAIDHNVLPVRRGAARYRQQLSGLDDGHPPRGAERDRKREK